MQLQHKKSIGVTSLSKDFKEIAINALASTCDKELMNESVPKVTARIVGDLSMIQIRESKKRSRPAFLDQENSQIHFASKQEAVKKLKAVPIRSSCAGVADLDPDLMQSTGSENSPTSTKNNERRNKFDFGR
jgi:hypothetical protein